MRVTQSMLTTSFLRNLSNSYQTLAKYQNQLSTGKKFFLPSDDPVAAMLGIKYHSSLGHIKQFQSNVSTAFKWMDSSGNALKEADSVMQRVNELVIQASNGTYNKSQLKDISDEIGQLKNQMVSVANTQVAGEYIFNGTDTNKKPVDLSSGIQVATNSNSVAIEVNTGIHIKINTDPTKTFSKSLFQDLTNLQNALASGASSSVISGYVPKIQQHLDNINSTRAELGAREERMKMVQNRLSAQNENVTKILSNNEDADMAKVIMELSTQESVHSAALETGARIMQPTLMNFLK